MSNEVAKMLYGMGEEINFILCYVYIFGAGIKNKKHTILFILGIALLNLLNIVMGINIDDANINMLYGILIPLFLLTGKRIKWVLIYPNVLLLTSIINICISYVWAMFMGVPHIDLMYMPVTEVCINCSFTIIMLVIIVIRKLVNEDDGIQVQFTGIQYFVMLIGLMALIFLIAGVQFMESGQTLNEKMLNAIGLVVSLAGIIFFFTMVMISVSMQRNVIYKHEKEMANMYLNNQENQIKLLLGKDTEMRRFRHDIRGHLTALNLLIATNDTQKAKSYIEQINEAINLCEIKSYTRNTAVDAIINEQERRMQENGIEFIWQGSIGDSDNHVEVYDLCTIFLNILANAIEACTQEGNEKKIYVSVGLYDKRIYITQKNKIANPVIFDKEGLPISQKADKKNHGIGCQNIRDAVKKYDGILKYVNKDGYFIVDIIL